MTTSQAPAHGLSNRDDPEPPPKTRPPAAQHRLPPGGDDTAVSDTIGLRRPKLPDTWSAMATRPTPTGDTARLVNDFGVSPLLLPIAIPFDSHQPEGQERPAPAALDTVVSDHDQRVVGPGQPTTNRRPPLRPFPPCRVPVTPGPTPPVPPGRAGPTSAMPSRISDRLGKPPCLVDPIEKRNRQRRGPRPPDRHSRSRHGQSGQPARGLNRWLNIAGPAGRHQRPLAESLDRWGVKARCTGRQHPPSPCRGGRLAFHDPATPHPARHLALRPI